MERIMVWIAWVLLVGSIVFWPLSTITWAKNEPQFVLGLSWLAIVLTALDILNTAYARKHIKEGNDEQ